MFKDDNNTPVSQITTRIANLQSALQAHQIDAALILQNSDLFYFTGTIQQSHLYVPADGPALLLVRKSYDRARAESEMENILPMSSPKALPDMLADHGLPLPGRLGMELDVLPVNLFKTYDALFAGSDLMDISPVIRTLRAVKSAYEIDIITRAAALSDQVAAHAATIIDEGMTELELAGLVEAHARKLGHQGLVRMRMWYGEMFYGHLLSGASAAVPSFLASPTGGSAANPAVAQGAGFNRLASNEPILLDYVFALDGYISDHTRIFSIGPLPGELQRAHDAMIDLQEQIKVAAVPGVTAGSLYELGLKIASEHGCEGNFMGPENHRVRFMGHGVGVELDELPLLAKGQEMPLAEGMVIALEPKMIFPGKGVVGIENTHVVTPTGLRQLGQYPDTVTVV